MPSPRKYKPLTVRSLIDADSELTSAGDNNCAVVLMTRIRLARNLAGRPFAGWANPKQRTETLTLCREAVQGSPAMKRCVNSDVAELDGLEKQILVERHLISRELSESQQGSGVLINREQTISVMVNEEDHLRLQVLRSGFQLQKAWRSINELDNSLEGKLDYAFQPNWGYITACPTNLGTGMRASAMMHLPALVISGQMEKIVRAVNQLGMVVRGLFGEGSDASGSIFQISNQTTLGESEKDIIKRLGSVLESIVDHELNARGKLMESGTAKIYDKIGRAYGVLCHSHMLSSSEAMNLLSLVRLGVDLSVFPDSFRGWVDRLFIEAQPGHVQYAAQRAEVEPAERDMLRAAKLRSEFTDLNPPAFQTTETD